MAVYDHTYRPYSGRMTAAWSRFLIIPRHVYRDIFASKLFTGFFALCFACPLIMALLIYLRHNVNALKILRLSLSNVVPIDGSFFLAFFNIQQSFAFLITVAIGPVLISRDLTNNALPLYLCRPFSRAEYVAGKMSVLVILLSAITWVPGLVLFLLQSFLEGAGWFTANLWIAGALIISSWAWIGILALLAMALSAWVKWRVAASAALFGLFIIPNAMAVFINELFDTWYGNLISLSSLMKAVTDALFREPSFFNLARRSVPPVWSDWAMLVMLAAFCLFVLAVKIKPYEVVR